MPAEGEGSWSQLRRLLQRVSDLEAEIQRAEAEKRELERTNEELAARVEVWVSTHTDAIVLGRDEFLELERERKDLAEAHQLAAAGQAEAEEQVQFALERHGMLRGEVDGLLARREAAAGPRSETARAVAELRSVAAQLERQLSHLDAERDALLEECQQLAEGAEESAANGGACDALRGSDQSREVGPAADLLESCVSAVALEACAAADAEVVPDASTLAMLQEAMQLRVRLSCEEEAVRLAESASTRSQELQSSNTPDAQRRIAELQSELSEGRAACAEWRAECEQATADLEALRAEATARAVRDAQASAAKATTAARGTGWLSPRSAAALLAEERAAREQERTNIRTQFQAMLLEAERQKRAATATLGQLVLEKQELADRLAAATAARGARTLPGTPGGIGIGAGAMLGTGPAP